MYRCPECGRIFEEPNYAEICWEAEYGVSGWFQDLHYGTVAECPYCETGIDIYMDEIDEEDLADDDE